MTQDAIHNSDSNHCISVENIRMGEKNNPYRVVLMSRWSSWFHSKEVSNKVASAVNFIQIQCIVSSGLHFSLYNSPLQVFKYTLQVCKRTLQVFKCTDDVFCEFPTSCTACLFTSPPRQKLLRLPSKKPRYRRLSSPHPLLQLSCTTQLRGSFQKKPWVKTLCLNAQWSRC